MTAELRIVEVLVRIQTRRLKQTRLRPTAAGCRAARLQAHFLGDCSFAVRVIPGNER